MKNLQKVCCYDVSFCVSFWQIQMIKNWGCFGAALFSGKLSVQAVQSTVVMCTVL